MAGKVTFLAIDKWREYLEYTIGRKLRDFFARNKGASIPPVTFYTPQQASAARLPQTGWYDYSEQRIGIVINPERNPKREWVWATLAVVHECLHWLFNHSPILVNVEKPLERRILNIFRDASNEQRGLLEFAWSRQIIRRGRRVILDEYFAARRGGQCCTGSPVYEAANLTLVAHTLLAARGFRLLRHLYSGKATPMAIWAVLEPVVGPPPSAVADDWPQAFDLAVRAWKERNEFDRADLVREFIALFPHADAVDQPPESPVDIGGHIGEETPASGDPPGAASLSTRKIVASTAKISRVMKVKTPEHRERMVISPKTGARLPTVIRSKKQLQDDRTKRMRLAHLVRLEAKLLSLRNPKAGILGDSRRAIHLRIIRFHPGAMQCQMKKALSQLMNQENIRCR